jgi:hypothetical protein
MGIMVAVVAPRFTATFSKVTLGGTARQLAGAIAYVRNLAAKNNRSYFLTIDLDHDEYWVTYFEPPPELALMPYAELEYLEDEVYIPYTDDFVKTTRLQKKVSFARIILEDGVELYDGRARIAIRPNGTADETVIHLTNPSERFYTVHLERYNGQATVHKGAVIPPLPPELTEREPPRRAEDAL